MPIRIVTPRQPRRKREPQPAPARGVRVQAKPEAPRGYEAGDAADRLFAGLRSVARGE